MHIISKSKYKNYIDQNPNITNCQKQLFHKYLDELGTIYQEKNSNIQIQTLLDNIYQTRDLMHLTKLKLLFCNFFSLGIVSKLFDKIKSNNMTDSEIINYIMKKNTKVSYNDKNKICDTNTYIFENLSLTLKNFFTKNNIGLDNIKYLDVGCGSGSKTVKFSKILGLNKQNINGTDIKSWNNYKHRSHPFPFKEISNDKLDYPKNNFDLITCFFVLHHVENLNELLDEIVRVTKPDGLILIVEHNVQNDYDHLKLDILHMLYGYLYDNRNDYLETPDFASYHNWLEWDFIMEQHGLKYIKSNFLYPSLLNDTRYDEMYYAIYQKI